MKAGNLISKIVFCLFVIFAASSTSAFAADGAGIDFTVLITQIDWSGVIAAIMTVAGGLSVLYMSLRGSKIIVAYVRSGG